MRPGLTLALIVGLPAALLFAQLENPQQPVQPESIKSNTPPPQTSSRVRFVGNTRFSDKELSAALADPLAGLTISSGKFILRETKHFSPQL